MRNATRVTVLVFVAAGGAMVLGGASAAPKRTARHAPGTARQPGALVKTRPDTRATNVVGTLGYDNDIPASRFGGLAVPVGNNFNVGVPTHSFSIMTVSFRLAGCFNTPYIGALAFLQEINPTAMTIMALQTFSASAGPVVSCDGGALYVGFLPTPIPKPFSPFFAGILNTPFGGCDGNTGVGGTCEGVALSAGTMDPGMGFHAVVVNGNMYTAIAPAKNAIIRVSGHNLPVELMDLSVE